MEFKLPFLSGIRELPPAARKFLLFTSVNVISWQCIVGPLLVLFGRALDMPPAWVGLMISFMPFSMLLVAFTVPLVEWLGPRNLLTWSWLTRNLFTMPIFAMPWAIAGWGLPGAWFILMAATLGFCVIRALGVGAWYPWLHEVVPGEQRGAYFANETIMVQLTSIIIMVVLAWIMGIGQGLNRFYWVYAIGISAGMLSVISIRWIPGGKRTPDLITGRHGFASYGLVREDRQFIRFVLLTFCCQAALMWTSAASIMYLRDMLGYSEANIMYLVGAGSLGIALTIGPWGKYADRYGSGPVMIQSLFAHSLIALAWLLLLPGAAWTNWLAIPVVVFSMIFNAIFLMVANRGMLCRVRETGRIAYTNFWVVGSSIATGLPPILAGLLIDYWDLAGFRACFMVSGIMGVISAAALFSLPAEEGKPPLPHLHDMLKPGQPLRTMARMVWISLGFKE